MTQKFFHSSKSFDTHLISRQRLEKFGKKITSIANNKEKYTAFTVGDIQFLDSYQFLNTSLEKVSESIPKEEFKYLKKIAKTREQMSLILKRY